MVFCCRSCSRRLSACSLINLDWFSAVTVNADRNLSFSFSSDWISARKSTIFSDISTRTALIACNSTFKRIIRCNIGTAIITELNRFEVLTAFQFGIERIERKNEVCIASPFLYDINQLLFDMVEQETLIDLCTSFLYRVLLAIPSLNMLQIAID